MIYYKLCVGSVIGGRHKRVCVLAGTCWPYGEYYMESSESLRPGFSLRVAGGLE
jgi:hypothetical protein